MMNDLSNIMTLFGITQYAGTFRMALMSISRHAD